MSQNDTERHFMFSDPQGALFEVDAKVIGAAHGLGLVAAACRKKGGPEHLACATAIDQALQNGIVLDVWSDNKKGDVPPHDKPEKQWDGKIEYFPTCSRRPTLVIIAPGPGRNQYQPQHRFASGSFQDVGHNIGPKPSTWGWHIDHLIPHASLITKIAKELEVSFGSKTLRNIAKLKEALAQGAITVRVPNVEVKVGRAQCCAVYSLKYKGYINRTGTVGNLAVAMTFEHEAAAQKWIKRNQHGSAKQYTVVPIEMRVTAAPTDELDSENLNIFREAMAQMNKEEIERSLKDCTIEQLQARLDEMGAPVVQATSKPKRM